MIRLVPSGLAALYTKSGSNASSDGEYGSNADEVPLITCSTLSEQADAFVTEPHEWGAVG